MTEASRVVDLTHDDVDGERPTRRTTMEDEIKIELCSGRQCPLTHLRRLLDGEWLNDEIINCFADVLCSRFKSTFLDSIVLKLWVENPKKVPPALYRQGTSHLPRYLIVNEHNVHWSLIEVQHASRQVLWYNRRAEIPALIRTVDARLHPLEYQWMDVALPHQAIQHDKTECGVFLCYFLLQRLEGVRIEALQRPPEDMRAHIANVLLDSSLDVRCQRLGTWATLSQYFLTLPRD
jgi:hypothetical protein